MKKINYPESFRFTSEMDSFKRCVDIASQLLETRQLSILFGCVKKVNFKLWLDENQFRNYDQEFEYQEFREILFNEVAVILEQNLEKPDLEEPELERFLSSNSVASDEIPYIMNEKRAKRDYVKDKLMTSDGISRYSFKEQTLNNKLLNIDFELNRFLFDDDSDILYSMIKIETSDLIETVRLPSILSANEKIDSVSFVCDKQDLEYIINTLERIKERM